MNATDRKQFGLGPIDSRLVGGLGIAAKLGEQHQQVRMKQEPEKSPLTISYVGKAAS